MLGLSLLYVYGRGLGPIDGALFGIKAAVLVIVVEALIRIGRRALKSQLLVALAALGFIGICFFALPFPLIVVAAAIIGFLVAQRAPEQLALSSIPETTVPPRKGRWTQFAISLAIGLVLWWAPVALAAVLLGSGHALVAVGLFFSKLAVVTFGGAYAVLAYMAQQAVEMHGWLERAGNGGRPWPCRNHAGAADPGHAIRRLHCRFPRGRSVFSLAGGLLGAAMTTWVTFIPPMLWIFAGAPFIEELRGNKRLAGALAAITAAVVGVILNLSVWFALPCCSAMSPKCIRTAALVRLRPQRARYPCGRAGATAAVLTFRFHRGLIEVIVVMALLGMATHFYG